MFPHEGVVDVEDDEAEVVLDGCGGWNDDPGSGREQPDKQEHKRQPLHHLSSVIL